MQTDAAHAPSAELDAQDTALHVLAYEWVRDQIIDGKIEHGSRIREREIAEHLNISRIPVREALPRLEAEGYIRTIHRRGAVVTPMRLQDVREIFVLRAALEVCAARLAAERCADGAPTDALRASLEAADEATRSKDLKRIASTITDLHDAIVTLADSPLLSQVMEPLRGRLMRLNRIVTRSADSQTQDEHRTICEAIMNGEVERAAALSLAHVEHSRHLLMPVAISVLGE